VKAIAEQSLYEILEVKADASPGEIAQAYERAQAIYAPSSLAVYTLVAPDEAAAFLRRVEEARSVLLDPDARARYDAGLLPPGDPAAAAAARPVEPAALPPVIPPVKVELAPAPEATTPSPAAAAAPGEAAAPAAAPTSPPAPAATAVPVATAVPAATSVPAATAAPVGSASAPEAAAAHEAAAGTVPEGTAATAAPPQAATPSAEAAEPAAPAAEPDREPPPPAAPPARPAQASAGFSVPEGTPWTGEVLRRVRESRGLTLHQIAERTKVGRQHLENIEADRYGMLPAPVYLRGILVSFAKELRLDGPKVSRSYLEQVRAASEQPPPQKPR